MASVSAEVSGTGVPSTSPSPLVEAVDVEKWFGAQPAVRGVRFSLPPGQFLVLFGPNGAGKTTLLRMLAGTMRPTRGEIRFPAAPGDEDDPAMEWRKRIGVLSHQTYLYGHLTARENLLFYSRLYGLRDPGARIDELLATVGLTERQKERVRTYSRGMQQRLALARTLLHDPELVLLDEPYTGLDHHAAMMLRDVLEHLRNGHRTVLMVTHNLGQGLELADRVVIQVEGRWIFDESRSAVDPSTFEHIYSENVQAALG